MNRWDQVKTVAWWEFRRFFKPRDQLIGLAIAVGIGVLITFGKKWAEGSGDEIKVVVQDDVGLTLMPLEDSELVFEPIGERTEEDIRALIEEDEVQGLLTIHDIDHAELLVEDDPLWQVELTQILTAARSQIKLGELNASPVKLQDAFAPIDLEISLVGGEEADSRKALRTTAIIIVVLSMVGIWTGLMFFLIGITGEKQNRVTEQVVAAITPQAWIDGKLIGLTMTAFATFLTYAVSILLILGLIKLSGDEIMIPDIAGNPAIITLIVVFAILGMVFWNCFYGAVAATMTDPYSSARGSLIIIPMLPFMLTMFGLKSPDSVMMTVMALTPGFSSTAMAARLVLTDVAVYEVILSLVLLLVGIYFLRRLAGKIFAAGILIYGKEPSLKEVWRWLREA